MQSYQIPPWLKTFQTYFTVPTEYTSSYIILFITCLFSSLISCHSLSCSEICFLFSFDKHTLFSGFFSCHKLHLNVTLQIFIYVTPWTQLNNLGLSQTFLKNLDSRLKFQTTLTVFLCWVLYSSELFGSSHFYAIWSGKEKKLVCY